MPYMNVGSPCCLKNGHISHFLTCMHAQRYEQVYWRRVLTS